MTIMTLCLLISSAYSADLYLMSIDSREALQTAKDVVEYAHGTINGKFLVELDSRQVERLRAAGIQAELVMTEYVPEKTYLASPMHPDIQKSRVPFTAQYVSGSNYLVKLEEGEVYQVRSAGYGLVLVESKRTPLFLIPVTVTPAFRSDFPSDTLADLIVQDSLYAYDARLQAFHTRYVSTDSLVAASNWVLNKFLSFGYTDVRFETFYYYGYPLRNVICTKPGTVEPNKIIVVGAHYDSFNQDSDPLIFAPGADDNGSGTAAVLEMARVLQNVNLKKTVIFAAFSAEEVGLVGSAYMASNLRNQGADLEFMLNFDMIGYTDDAIPDVTLFSGPVRVYADVLAAAATRVTDLIPVYAGAALNSDHASFVDQGYDATYAQEGDFNNPGWHHNIDSTSRMNFPYMTKVVKMAAAALGHVDNAARPTRIDNLFDFGNGHDLRVVWSTDCQPNYNYKVLYGTDSAIYTDTIDVPFGNCSYDLTGLIEGQRYYVSVMGINQDGYGPIYLIQKSEMPLVIPRAPASFVADPDSGHILLTWKANQELDLDHYELYRQDSLASWRLLVDNLSDSFYVDWSPLGHVSYQYEARALDHDLNASSFSALGSAVAATFDGGVLFVEETAAGGVNPSETKQNNFYDSIFTDHYAFKYKISNNLQKMGRSLAGQYGSVFWFDDDFTSHLLDNSLDSLTWYLNYSTNVFIAGMETVSWVSGPDPLGPGDFFYDNFGIARVNENSSMDFIGATGVNGWPDLHTATDNAFSGILPTVSVFELRPGAQVIYTYNSNSGNMTYQGKPAGVIYETPKGKRIAFSFPICQLREADAQALIAKVYDYFGQASGLHPYGDATGDGLVNISDIVFIINYLYRGGTAPHDPNYADVNGNCIINIQDISYLMKYLYLGGPAPVQGCVQP
jgi:Peptidase family M28/Dockerin type I domain